MSTAIAAISMPIDLAVIDARLPPAFVGRAADDDPSAGETETPRGGISVDSDFGRV
jgi:hypothetical protein